MKKFLLSFLAVLVLFCGVIANSQITNLTFAEDNSSFSVCVIGEASKDVKPDLAKIFASIETLDMDAKNSKNLNLDTFSEVVSALTDFGITEEGIVLESYTAYPSYDYSAGKTLTGYYTLTSFSVDVVDLENVKPLIDLMTEKGVTSICSINFEVSNLDEIYNEVLAEALQNAENKAKQLTKKTELQIVDINEESQYYSTSLYKNYSDSLQSSQFVGDLIIKAKVLVKYI